VALPAGSFGKVVTHSDNGWVVPMLVGLGLGMMLGAFFVLARRPLPLPQLPATPPGY